MKTIEETIKAINNRLIRIDSYQNELKNLMVVDETFKEVFFEQEAIKDELIALLSYIEE